MRKNTIDIPKETLEHLYWQERLSMKAIADKLRLSITPVYRSMERHNIKRRSDADYAKIDRELLGITRELLNDLYITRQLPAVYIAQQFAVSDKTIRKLLQDFRIPIRTRHEVQKLSAPKRLRGKDGHGRNWKGGRIKGSNGYMMLWNPEHPKATIHGYVFEHILIWEETYGKPLPKGWIVHHYNGIKTDNRSQNLVAMKRSEHINQAKPYIKRIQELEAQMKELQQLQLTIG